jgi:lipopolysaccharide export system protein LptA
MRWQRSARVLALLIGFGCVIALLVYSRKRPALRTVPTAVLTNPTVTSKGNKVVSFRFDVDAGKESLRVEADEQTEFADGRMRLDHVHYTATRPNGVIFDIWADAAESQGKVVKGDQPGLIQLTGHVHTKSSDGLEVFSDTAVYDNVNGLATIPGKMTFTRGRLKGDGVGATYDRNRDVLWLQDQARVVREPDQTGGGALEATAKSIGVARTDKYMNLIDHARVVQPDRTLASDNALVHFTDDDRGAKAMELHGNARVQPGPAAQKDAPDLQADEIALEFQDDGQTLHHAAMAGKARLVQVTDQGKQTISAATIDITTAADGRTLTNLQARTGVEVLLPANADNPDRTIRAPTLVTSGDEKVGLKTAVFDGGVTFIEKRAAAPSRGGRGGAPAIDRTATCTSLALQLKGQLGAIQSSEFRQNVNFRDGDMKAGADLAVHDEAAGTLLLTPAKASKSAPWVDDGSVRVDAMWIQVDLDTHDLRAKDKVKAKMSPSKSASGVQTKTPGLFESDQPVYGNGTALKYVNASKNAEFGGEAAVPANVYQPDGKNKIRAKERITIEQDTGNLSASGDVESVFQLESSTDTQPNPKTSGSAAAAKSNNQTPTPTTVRARQMTYVDADRKALYAGEPAKPVVLNGPDGDVIGREVVLLLQKTERALQTLEATGEMFATFEGGREALGDKLVYDAITEEHIITGKPMYFKNIQNDSGKDSCTLEKSTELHYEGKGQTITEPGSAPKALRTSVQMPCDKPLKTFIQTSVPAAK